MIPPESNKGEKTRRSPEDFRALAVRVLHYANLGVSRIDFQRQICQILLEFCGCDAIGIRAADGGFCYCGEATRRPTKRFDFEILTPRADEQDESNPCEGEPESLDGICYDVMQGKVDTSSPFITKNKSLWISDVDNPPVSADQASGQTVLPAVIADDVYKSILAVPFVIDDQNNGIAVMRSMDPGFFTEREVELYEAVAQNLGAAIAARRSRAECHERVKELTCMFGIAQVASQPDLSIEDVLRRIVELIPPGWQYPEITHCRIILDGRAYATEVFKDEWQSQRAGIAVAGKKRGLIEVAYSQQRPELDEGPFAKEQRKLIDAIAAQIALIVERRESQEERLRLQDQLRHADRLATVGQMAAGVAHEFNEPLGNILGFAQLILRNRDLADEVKRDVEKIVDASIHAREVGKKLMQFARQQPANVTKVNLNKVIRDSLYFLEARCFKAGIEMVRNLEPDLPNITADPVQLHQVLVNLVVNAIQAMPDGGVLTISTKADDDAASLIVEDTGVGMSDDIKDKLFVPFFTTKEIGEGTGLGLAVVYGIVVSYGGSVGVESTVGEGSRFEIRFPLKWSDEKED